MAQGSQIYSILLHQPREHTLVGPVGWEPRQGGTGDGERAGLRDQRLGSSPVFGQSLLNSVIFTKSLHPCQASRVSTDRGGRGAGYKRWCVRPSFHLWNPMIPSHLGLFLEVTPMTQIRLYFFSHQAGVTVQVSQEETYRSCKLHADPMGTKQDGEEIA